MKTALSQAAFDYVSKNYLIYGTCWEDPAIDRKALNLAPEDTVLAITSAGCNVLDYALCRPKRIFAVDANPHQNALLDLRLSAIRNLEYDDFFQIFGHGWHPSFESLYRRRLRSDLAAFSQHYWDRRQSWFSGGGVRTSFYLHAMTGWIALFFRAVTFRFRDEVERLLSATTLEEQSEVWDKRIRPALWTPFFRWMVSQQFFMTAMGVPASQTNALGEGAEGPADYIRHCFERVVCELPFWTNYFWQVYMRNGTYTKTCCPEYLR
jgi:S-adenosylmethionine-diacylglycerol 3-amino-3-carboxypropyl transferase